MGHSRRQITLRTVGTLFALSLVMAVASVGHATATPRPGAAATAGSGWCWCTAYVANRFNLPRNYPNAQDWGAYLVRNKFRQVWAPQSGDIVVYSGSRLPTAGHVGIIASVSSGSLSVRGANQASNWSTWTEWSCTNVSQGNYIRITSKKQGAMTEAPTTRRD